jgi:hypothetical protein
MTKVVCLGIDELVRQFLHSRAADLEYLAESIRQLAQDHRTLAYDQAELSVLDHIADQVAAFWEAHLRDSRQRSAMWAKLRERFPDLNEAAIEAIEAARAEEAALAKQEADPPPA